MSNLTNQPIPSKYTNLLNLNNNVNTGLTTVLESVQDGLGKSCPLELSVDTVNINYSVGPFLLNGEPLNATASSINASAAGIPPSGTTAQRPLAPNIPTLYFNTDTQLLQVFTTLGWQSLDFI